MKAALLLIAGVIAGVAAGGYGGVRYGSGLILDDCMHQAARDVERLVATLKHVRAGQRDQAVELVEAWMDDALILFAPAQPYHGLQPKTVAEMNKALQDAKDYRAANPRKSSRPHVDKMVADVLTRGAYQQ